MYWLTDEFLFPDPRYASEAGLLAAGGDLTPQRILFAYQEGIFPWYSEGEPILWWSPDPRFVLRPDEIKVSKSMRQVLRKGHFSYSFDRTFDQVIEACATAPRKGQDGTWLTPEMIQAYKKLHQSGFAHSVEVWEDKKLVGGLYGISLGKFFFGESMFTKVSNASKAALIYLAKALKARKFEYIDCQAHTAHLESMGAKFIPRDEFLTLLSQNKYKTTLKGSWKDW